MNRTRTGRRRSPRRHRLVSLIALAGLILSTGCGSVFPTLRPVSSQGTIIYHQYIVVMILSVIVFLIVFGLLGWILLHYRGNEGDDEPNQTSGNKVLEITWITIPVLMLIGLFIYSAVNMRSVEANDSSALQINVIGHQWWWEYQYPSLGIDTASELHLPVGTPVRLNITGADVIHSFWVPDLGWKMDAIPGKSNPMNLNLTQTGTFDGSCAEFCGSEHAWMRIRVISQNQSRFQQLGHDDAVAILSTNVRARKARRANLQQQHVRQLSRLQSRWAEPDTSWQSRMARFRSPRQHA